MNRPGRGTCKQTNIYLTITFLATCATYIERACKINSRGAEGWCLTDSFSWQIWCYWRWKRLAIISPANETSYYLFHHNTALNNPIPFPYSCKCLWCTIMMYCIVPLLDQKLCKSVLGWEQKRVFYTGREICLV